MNRFLVAHKEIFDEFAEGRFDRAAFERWITESFDDAVKNPALGDLRYATIGAVKIRLNYTYGIVSPLSNWLPSFERAHYLDPNDPALPKSRVLDEYYRLAGMIESVENQFGELYTSTLGNEISGLVISTTEVSRVLRDARLLPEFAEAEIDAFYEGLDRLAWVLDCVKFFKLEFPGRLAMFDLHPYRQQLTALEPDFREVVKVAKTGGWHCPDRDAPKSFWWRQ